VANVLLFLLLLSVNYFAWSNTVEMKTKDKITADFVTGTVADIESFHFSPLQKKRDHTKFQLIGADRLMSDLRGKIGVLFVRSLLSELGVDEHYVFKWRIDNKLVQYLIFDHYAPGCMPETIALSEVVDKQGHSNSYTLIQNGFFLKETLGHSSGDHQLFDKTPILSQVLRSFKVNPPEKETYVFQKKLDLVKEIRIHTFQQDVIDELTFDRYGYYSSFDYTPAEIFLNEILEKLPVALLHGALIGWDIGLTAEGQYYIIEANFTGFHPEHQPGFHTSGYFQDNNNGPVCCARLNNYFKKKYHMSVGVIEHKLLDEHQFFKAVSFYLTLPKAKKHPSWPAFKNNDVVALPEVAALSFIDLDIVHLKYMLDMYRQQLDFIKKYYLICTDVFLADAVKLFEADEYIIVIPERSLYQAIHYQFIKHLDADKRMQIGYLNAHEVLKEDFCFFVQYPSKPLKKIKIDDLFIQNKPINFKYLVKNGIHGYNMARKLLKMESSHFKYESHSIYSLPVLRILYSYLADLYGQNLITALIQTPNVHFALLYFTFLENLDLYHPFYAQVAHNPVIKIDTAANFHTYKPLADDKNRLILTIK